MKIGIFVWLLVLYFSFANICFADNFLYLGEGIYYKKGSLRYENGFKFGTFKVIDKDSTNYEIINCKALCNSSKFLALINSKLYNKDNKLINEYEEKGVYPSDYTGYANGHIYYYAICKNSN